MLTWLVNRIYTILEPRLKALIADAVTQAVQQANITVEADIQSIIDQLPQHLGVLGGLAKGILNR